MAKKSALKYTYKIVVGDWSCDGHGRSEYSYFKSSHKMEDIKEAYLKTVKQIKVSLHQGGYGAKLPLGNIEILTDYEDSRIPDEAIKRFNDAGIDLQKVLNEEGEEEHAVFDGGLHIMPEELLVVFLAMVKLQIPDFKYEKCKDEVQCINGWWSEDFNYSFGYGLFHP